MALLAATAVASGLTLGWLDATGVTASTVAGAFTIAAGLLSLRLSRRAQRAESLALRDSLTGLPNRMLLDDRVDRVLEQAQRDVSSFAVLVIDLDGFKGVNDLRGHDAGDAVLRSIARRLEGVIRASDTVARVGGDEFVVLSPGTGSEPGAEDLAGRLRQALRRPYRIDETDVEIDASIGWALYPRDGDRPERLLAHADNHMYVAKHDDASQGAPRRMRLDACLMRELESVLRGRGLVVHYQPVIDLPSGGVSAIEALVRRRHPQHGLIGPHAFVPHLEATPMMRALTLRVVDEGLRVISRLAERDHVLRLSVNVSYRMLGDRALADEIAERLTAAGTPLGTLALEVSLRGGVRLVEPSRAAVDALVAAGVRLSLDDVGRSAPLAALTAQAWDEMKIDASLVRDAGRVDEHTSVVGALARLGRDLGLAVVAEGIEHRDALEAVIALGCDHAQGFYIQKALAAEELTRWLEGGRPAVALAV